MLRILSWLLTTLWRNFLLYKKLWHTVFDMPKPSFSIVIHQYMGISHCPALSTTLVRLPAGIEITK